MVKLLALLLLFSAVLVNGDWLVKKHKFTNGGTLSFNGTKDYDTNIQYALSRTHKDSDGEAVDAMEHYFYGQVNGIAMELGGLDGSAKTG
jgi:hypothetical protein